VKVEVAYARPDVQVILETEVPAGATIEEAIRASGILERFPEIDLDQQKVGIFSRAAPLSQELREWDRVEIYRPLIVDPKAARRDRAQRDDRKRANRKAESRKNNPEGGKQDKTKAGPASGAAEKGDFEQG